MTQSLSTTNQRVPPKTSEEQQMFSEDSVYYMSGESTSTPNKELPQSKADTHQHSESQEPANYQQQKPPSNSHDDYDHDFSESNEMNSMFPNSMDHRRMMHYEDEVDSRSVFVGNVDYGTTPSELQDHFKSCGPINRITIMVDRHTGHPKGFAYVEFMNESALPHAMALDQSSFRDRPLKVVPKRKNIPGFNRERGYYRSNYMSSSMPYPSAMRGGRMRGRSRAIPGYFPRHRGRGMRGSGIYPY